MFPGFLPTARPATLMFDVVILAMAAVIPILAFSIYVVRNRRNYALHKAIQTTLGVVLLVAVVLFEVDIRLDGSWWERAKESPYYARGILTPLLTVHVIFSVTTTLLWAFAIIDAWRRFPSPIRPSEYSPRHRVIGWLAAADMFCTGITGWTFYWMAFCAT